MSAFFYKLCTAAAAAAAAAHVTETTAHLWVQGEISQKTSCLDTGCFKTTAVAIPRVIITHSSLQPLQVEVVSHSVLMRLLCCIQSVGSDSALHTLNCG
jgi:hypothetical protein